ncbi:VOC family protein [Phenylobacterium sp.]|uniref:VOC family protein n=1 Tax=Phenylobacterium sp. TaxID=1871053 RepID=UPI00286ACAED|nr:VOC family protein [Phenylobacterium sp.]
MIGYTTIGTNDLEKAKAFYDAVLGTMGVRQGYDGGRILFYGKFGAGGLALCEPYDKQPAVPGNGTMVALAAESRDMVDAIHAEALAQGATCDGPPGLRGSGFYGAYFRDLDGNKICAFKMMS